MKYAALGDISFFFAFGVLPMFGTYWVQTQTFSWLPVLWSVPVVLFTVGILHANNWYDIEGDRAKRCITLAGLLGERWSAVYYRTLMLGPFVLTGLYVLARFVPDLPVIAPWAAVIVFIVFPIAMKLCHSRRDDNGETFRMLDGKTAQLQLLFSALLLVAFIAAGYLPVLR